MRNIWLWAVMLASLILILILLKREVLNFGIWLWSYFKKQWRSVFKGVIATIVTILSLYLPWQAWRSSEEGVDLQRAYIKTEQKPLFQYSYDKENDLFMVAGEGVDIKKIDWFVVAGEPRITSDDRKRYLQKANNLNRALARREIRDVYNPSMNPDTVLNDYIECEFFRLVPDGIPAKISIVYDAKWGESLESTDVVLINRLDTENPDIEPIERNVVGDDAVTEILQKNMWQLNAALDHMEKFMKDNPEDIYTNRRPNGFKDGAGKCGVIMNQPFDGY